MLPDRVRRAIRIQEDVTERLIGGVEFASCSTFSSLYAVAPKTFPAGQTVEPVPWIIGAYFLFTLFCLRLAVPNLPE
jgi:adenylate cyclase